MKPWIALPLCLATPAVADAATPSDLRDYALASCLIKQTASKSLQTEGYRLGNVVIERAGITPFTWKSLDTAVGAALAKRGMLLIHVDGPVDQATQPAPLASCLRIIDAKSVQRVAARLSATPPPKRRARS